MADNKIPSLNLIRQVNPESAARNPSFYKAIGLDVLTVASAAAVGFFYNWYLEGKADLATLILCLVVFAVFSALQLLLAKSFVRRFWILVLEVAAVLGFFYSYNLEFLAITGGAALVLLSWGEMRGRSALENGLEIKFFSAAGPVLRKLVTVLSFLLVVLYLPRLNQSSIFMSQDNFRSFFDFTNGVVSNFYPEINLNSSFGQLTESFARLELETNSTFRAMSPSDRAAAIQQVSSQVSNSLSKILGVAISPNEATSDVFYNFIVGTLNGWSEKFGVWFIFGWALTVFLIIRSFGVLFYWAASFMAFIVYQILLTSGVVHIIGEARTHEIAEF
jgi:hypothetical protein